MDNFELAKTLIGVHRTEGSADKQKRTVMVTGEAVSDSANGKVLVDMGGESVTLDGAQAVELESTVDVRAGDTVKILLTGVDGGMKHATVIGVIGRGDETKAEVEVAKADAETAKTDAETAKTDAETAKADAESAKSSADQAQGTAEAAKQKADEAKQSADTAKGLANSAGKLAAKKAQVFYQSTKPTGGKSGDVWFNTAEDNAIFKYENGWKRMQLGSNAIADASIKTAKIQDGAITNAKIGNLDAGKITAGTLKAVDVKGVHINGSVMMSDWIGFRAMHNIIRSGITPAGFVFEHVTGDARAETLNKMTEEEIAEAVKNDVFNMEKLYIMPAEIGNGLMYERFLVGYEDTNSSDGVFIDDKNVGRYAVERPVTLYWHENGGSKAELRGSNQKITLSDSVANYHKIEIQFINNDLIYGCQVVLDPDQKWVDLSTHFVEEGVGMVIKATTVNIYGNVIEPIAGRHLQHGAWNGGHSVSNGNYNYITKVVGYKWTKDSEEDLT